MSTSILGIDPGNNGGMVLLVERSSGWSLDKCFKLERGERAICEFMKQHVTSGTAVYLEKVHGWGEARSFNFGKYYGFVRGCAMMRTENVSDVPPRVWMPEMGVEGKSQTKEKRQSMRLLAGQVQGEVEPTNWNAAAILIALFGLRQEGGELR